MLITEIPAHLMETLAFLGKNHWALGVCVIACCLVLSVLLYHSSKTRLLCKKVKRLEQELKVARTSAVAMGQQILTLEKQMDSPRTSLASTSVAVPPSSFERETSVKKPEAVAATSSTLEAESQVEDQQSVYDEAKYFLSQGNDVSDVATKCGLSYAEVSLLKALNNPGAISQKSL